MRAASPRLRSAAAEAAETAGADAAPAPPLSISRPQLNSTFTIEPILTEGSPRFVEWKDKWTVVTADGGLAAQAEHTVLITPDGAEVLTVA
jgi:hypothetical protein